MSIETDLKKDGITVIEALDEASAISVAQSASEKLYSSFSNFGLTYEDLFEKLSKIPMYIASIPNGMSEASYFYKNSSIYFRDGMGLTDLEKFSVHEFIHYLQERKGNKGNLIRLGLCEFKGTKVTGMALNEAAVQILSSNALNYTFENVEYYGVTFPTISPNVYPLLCNLVTQMAYITGEDILFDSTFNSNNNFQNKFIALCGKKSYKNIIKNLDKILYTEEDIINLNNTLQNKDLDKSKSEKIMNKISGLKLEIKELYFATQELIIVSYFGTLYTTLITTTDVELFRKSLYNFQELIGTSSDYYFFNNFYIDMMERLDNKSNSVLESTYLVPQKENKLIKILIAIKNLILFKIFDKEKQ